MLSKSTHNSLESEWMTDIECLWLAIDFALILFSDFCLQFYSFIEKQNLASIDKIQNVKSYIICLGLRVNQKMYLDHGKNNMHMTLSFHTWMKLIPSTPWKIQTVKYLQ